MSDRLFVYGTLRPGKAPAEISGVVNRLKPLGNASIRAQLHQFPEYPAIRLNPRARKRIPGTLFGVIDTDALERLDAYEEFYPSKPNSSLFLRKLARVRMEDGSDVEAWVYEYAKPLPVTESTRRKRVVKDRVRAI